jgi:uncharacterized protein involved in exopolysaccharide biosynthesis
MSSIEILIFLLKRKRYVIGIPFLAGVLGFVLAWISPQYFKSDIRVFLDTGPKKTNIASLVKNAAPSSLLGSMGTGMDTQENEDLYLEILAGRDVLLATIDKFKLDTIYKGAKYRETLLKQFEKDIKIEVDDVTGIISCEYEAMNKELARDLVRFVVEEANTKYITLRRERALQTIDYLNSLKQNILANADSLSEVLIKFYRSNNLLNLASQLQLTMATLAGYEDQIKNFKISEMKAGTDNSSANELRKRRAILEREFQKLRGEYSDDYLPSKNSIYINSEWAIEKLIELEKLEGDLKRLFVTFEMVEGNIVMEEANAAKNLPVVQIVQDAYLPDYKSKPKRAIWAGAAFLLSTCIVCLALILSGMLKNEISCEEKTRENFKGLIKACLNK